MRGAITPHHVAAHRHPRRQRRRCARGAGARPPHPTGRVRATRVRGKVTARVEPEVLDRHDPLANLGDLENALYLRTDLLDEIGIVQRRAA